MSFGEESSNISLWGILNRELVDPSTPDAKPVLICNNKNNSYDIESGEFIEGTYEPHEVSKALDNIGSLPISLEPQNAHTNFGKLMLPLIRKVYPSIIVKDLISVQPMTKLIGFDFYKRDTESIRD